MGGLFLITGAQPKPKLFIRGLRNQPIQKWLCFALKLLKNLKSRPHIMVSFGHAVSALVTSFFVFSDQIVMCPCCDTTMIHFHATVAGMDDHLSNYS